MVAAICLLSSVDCQHNQAIITKYRAKVQPNNPSGGAFQ